MLGSAPKCPVWPKNALPSMHQLTLPLSNTAPTTPPPSLLKLFFNLIKTYKIYMNENEITTVETVEQFCVIVGIMTGLLRRCLWSTLGLRANDYVTPSLRSGFNCILYHSLLALRGFTNKDSATPIIIPQITPIVLSCSHPYPKFSTWTTKLQFICFYYVITYLQPRYWFN